MATKSNKELKDEAKIEAEKAKIEAERLAKIEAEKAKIEAERLAKIEAEKAEAALNKDKKIKVITKRTLLLNNGCDRLEFNKIVMVDNNAETQRAIELGLLDVI